MVFVDWSTMAVLTVQVYAISTMAEMVPILGLFVVLDLILGRWVAWRCQPEVKRVQLKTIGHELLFSVVTMVAGMLTLELVHRMEAAGVVELVVIPRGERTMEDNLWLAGQTLYLLLGFDMWFYAMHRLMHSVPWLYRNVHKAHHRSTSPTALTSAAFSPIETFFISLGLLILLAAAGRLQASAVSLSGVIGAIYNMVVHLGVEFFPRWWHSNPVSSQIVCTSFHDVHHAKFTCNYGLYLTSWDRLLQTMSPSFDKKYHDRWMAKKTSSA